MSGAVFISITWLLAALVFLAPGPAHQRKGCGPGLNFSSFFRLGVLVLPFFFTGHLRAQSPVTDPPGLSPPALDWIYPPAISQPDAAADSIDPVRRDHRISFLQDDLATDLPGQPDPAGPSYQIDAVVRSYYQNDQRMNFSGQTSLFGVEGDLIGTVKDQVGEWDVRLDLSLFLHQPFDGNLLVDSPVRESFRGNFEYEVVELDNLAITGRRGDFQWSLGKMPTPFGRYYFRYSTNERWDAPFIRTESILWKETGLLVQHDPGIWVLTAAATNGGPERDGNSSKAFIGRIGIETDNFVLGASVKWQDGIGSEGQKTFNNHIGLDTMFRWKQFVVSGEVIYDEYGTRRPGFDVLEITWGRSIYNRDLNSGGHEIPITGVGYYVDISSQGEEWQFSLNYGEFYPDPIGDAIHDVTTRRGLIRATRFITPTVSVYGLALLENDIPVDQANRYRKGWAILAGIKWEL